jgi:hypothetical protein
MGTATYAVPVFPWDRIGRTVPIPWSRSTEIATFPEAIGGLQAIAPGATRHRFRRAPQDRGGSPPPGRGGRHRRGASPPRRTHRWRGVAWATSSHRARRSRVRERHRTHRHPRAAPAETPSERCCRAGARPSDASAPRPRVAPNGSGRSRSSTPPGWPIRRPPNPGLSSRDGEAQTAARPPGSGRCRPPTGDAGARVASLPVHPETEGTGLSRSRRSRRRVGSVRRCGQRDSGRFRVVLGLCRQTTT